jgi:hypothetical protein
MTGNNAHRASWGNLFEGSSGSLETRRLYRIHTGSSIRQGSTVNVVASGYVVHLKMKPTMRAIIGVWVSPYSTHAGGTTPEAARSRC